MPTIGEEIKDLKNAGFNDKEIESYKKEKIFDLEQAEFNDEEILKEFGYKKLNMQPIQDIWDGVIKDQRKEKKSIYEKLKEVEKNEPDNESLKEKLVGQAFEPLQYWKRGWGAGIWNLKTAYETDGVLPELYTEPQFDDTGIIERNIQNIATIIKDLPIYAVGGGIGFFTTRSPGGAIATAGMVGGSIRQAYLTALQNGEVNNFSAWWDAFTKEGIKAGAKEAAQLYAAYKVPSLMGKYGKGFVGNLIGQVTGFETVGAIIEGELPSKEQLTDSFILFGTLGLAGRGINKAVNVVKKSERNAIELAEDMITDKTVIEDISSANRENPRAYGIKEEPRPEVIPDKFKDGISFETKAEQKLFDKTRYTDVKEKTTFKENKNFLAKNLLDRHHPILELVRKVDKEKNPQGVLNVYEKFRSLVGMDYRAGTFIEIATLDKNLKNKGKSFNQIMKPIAETKQTYAEFNNYQIAKRVIELESRGIDHGFDIQAAREVVNNKKLIKKYEKTSKELEKYQRELLEYVKDRGLISEVSFNAMLEANKNYIPFSRVLEAKKGDTGYTKGVSNPMKRIKGAKGLDTFDPIETVYKNTFHLVKLAERNAALIDFVNFIEKNKEAFPDINKKKSPTKTIEVQKKELEAAFSVDIFKKEPTLKPIQELLLPKEVTKKIRKTKKVKEKVFKEGIDPKALENFNIFRKEFLTPDDSSVGVYRNGKFEVWEVGKELAEALSNFDPRQMGMINRYLSKPASWLRAGATLSPDFVVANILRDTVSASVFSKSGFVPIWSSLQGLGTLIGGKTGLSKTSQQIYQKWIRSGGMQSTLVSLDRNVFDKPAFEILNQGPIRNKIKSPFEYLRVMSELSENMTRIQEFKLAYNKSRKLGLSEKEAIERGGFESRDITIDYAKMGTKIRGINQLVAFYNARLQGYAKVYDAFAKRPGRASLLITGGIILPSIYFWFANKDDERVQRQPEWVKDHYWIIPTEDKLYKIPKPFELGVVFGTGTEKFLDFWSEENPDDFKRFTSDFLWSNTKNVLPIPQAGLPIFETITNYKVFTDTPLVPYYMDKNLPSKYQYTMYTSETAKLISKGINSIIGTDYTKLDNPIVIDNFIRAWTGGIGGYIVREVDKNLVKYGVVKDPIKPTDSLTRIPFIRAFDLRDPSPQSEFIADFYREFDKINKKFKAISALEKRGDFDEAIKLREEIKNKNELYLISVKDAIKELNSVIRNIYNTKEYTPDEKRELIDTHYLLMIKAAKRGLDYINNKVEEKEEK